MLLRFSMNFDKIWMKEVFKINSNVSVVDKNEKSKDTRR